MQLNFSVSFNAQTDASGKEVSVECDSKVREKRKGQWLVSAGSQS